ncbi:hypoxia-inducible factor 1-alpha-like isoform X2 [Biomphalaria glabrata]|uniref:Hypoxia-inducible factor 1-alpha-like isoform X2 n=1 Tax=Biomphalaria glabrata TaxID=6526 RepID=A0A9W2ZWF2_BIOGL|nr:hypoxia-inducible factor 1-alpha-like isoform X2 [Biomphalaria glabrata]XP_055879232.1 hypoxia-inducible factor 1-alpha-like isoform X2 [Biomphalaria glabrata]XP_055879233.1 hypoxia-inducible factor 1-alpha-like isoform X2 [Biomphalaria glabrata]
MPYKNTEKRKEKSRDAARCRRGKETEVFTELASCLPITESVCSQLDKASIMRLSISMLKIYGITNNKSEAKNCKNAKGEKLDHLCQKALEGFAFILSPEGDIVYLTENVTKYLGLQQIELMGQSVYEFTHPCDHDEIKEILTNKQASQQKSSSQPENKIFFLRMKCTLTAKGRNVNLKSATFKVMRCTGRLVTKEADIVDLTLENSCPAVPYLVGIAEPIPHPVNIEVPLDSKTFLSKHSMDMHFTFCDERIEELAGYNSDEMIGQSMYDFHHALDSDVIDKAFKDLFAKGQTMTGAYRFLAKEGGYIWVITQATIINNSRTQKPQWVVCVHYVLSCIEEKGAILSHVQHNSEAKAKQADVLPAKLELTPENMFMPQKVELSTENIFMPPKVELSTENIFIPKTKEMDTGYFIPPELKSTMTFINDEPEDLSYLAPNPGDESVPLIFTYGRDVLLSPAPVLKKEPRTSTPDLCYRKDASPASLMSSTSSSRIPSPSDYLSFAVPGDVEAMDQFFQSIKAGDNDQDVEEIDFDMRAPYIPMDAEEDLGLLPPSSNVLFNLTSDINPGLFGQTESVFEPKHSLFDEVPQPPKQSVRDMLSGSTTVASIEQPPDTMYLQLKRPLDMNSLENGPPRNKVSRLEPGSLVVQTDSLPVTGSETRLINKDSVLLNLLLRGEDRVYGYKVNNMSGNNKNNHLGLLPNLTSHDCEVNAPIAANHLLQGSELLHALEALTSSKLAPKVIRPHL